MFAGILTITDNRAYSSVSGIKLYSKTVSHRKTLSRRADRYRSNNKKRQTDSEPIVPEFFKWVYQQRQRMDLLPSNPFTKALTYASNRQTELKIFLANLGVAMDTNHVERALSVIPMERKNYLFCWSELGAEQLGILQSLLVACRLQGINPHDYLVHALQRVI
ncbi:MAG: hypothetical protein ACJAUP_001546 [Cellvibrionaceae bacterium]|jgi:hypothetical protein